MRDLFSHPRVLIGVIHVSALPGTPHSVLSVAQIAKLAVEEAKIFVQAGFDGIIIENMHDRPYLKNQVGPEIVAAMARVCSEVRSMVSVPLGIQVLAGANEASVAIAHACDANFVRAEGFVFGHVADEGLIEASAGPLLRYRKAIGAEKIRILCDIKKKHSSHAITSDLDLAETAQAAEFFSADGLVVTGLATGQPADPTDLEKVARATNLPVWIGSGITVENASRYQDAHGLIVGSWIKESGDWRNRVCPKRCEALAKAFR